MLAELLETRVDPRAFDLGQWFEDAGWKEIGDRTEWCDTVACAVGWACSFPEFNALGLHKSTAGCESAPVCDGGGRGRMAGWAAVEHFFELTHAVAWWLFHPGAYWSDSWFDGSDADLRYDDCATELDHGPKDVAARIREFVGSKAVKA